MAYELPLGLPRTVVLRNKYSNKYLGYYSNEEDKERHGLLQFSAELLVNPYAKFHVEPSKASKDLVHIRCAYNNKYWRRLEDSGQFWIGAFADSPEEDQSKWSCTLFRPIEYENPHADPGLFVRFVHVQLNRYACLFNSPGSPYHSFLYAGWEDPNQNLMDVCQVVDRDAHTVLPRLVAFKGADGVYLRYFPAASGLMFQGKDIGADGVGHEVFNTSGGAIRIKSIQAGRFWRRIADNNNLIATTSTDTSENDSDTVFWPVEVDGNVIGLRCDGNDNFCMRRTYTADAFVAQASNINQEVRIQVEELVLSREIYDVEFRVQDGRIYDQNIILASVGYATNDTSSPLTHKVTLKHTETTSNTWQANVTLKLGVKTKIKTGIPFLVGGEIEISAEASRSTAWGDTHTTSNELTNEYDALVKPHNRVTVSLLATQGTCDVPFSYTLL